MEASQLLSLSLRHMMYPLRLLSLPGKPYSKGLLVPPSPGLTIHGVDHSKSISIGGDIFTGQQQCLREWKLENSGKVE
jgi:hypothetical protein